MRKNITAVIFEGGNGFHVGMRGSPYTTRLDHFIYKEKDDTAYLVMNPTLVPLAFSENRNAAIEQAYILTAKALNTWAQKKREEGYSVLVSEHNKSERPSLLKNPAPFDYNWWNNIPFDC